MDNFQGSLRNCAGWLFYISVLGGMALLLPRSIFDPESADFLLLLGAVGIWRYSMGAIHYVRGLIFLYLVYPHQRRRARKLGAAADPSHVYLLVTSFRIDALTTAAVYRSVIPEAMDRGYLS